MKSVSGLNRSLFCLRQHLSKPFVQDALPCKSTWGYYHCAISGHFCDSSISNNLVTETLLSLRAYKEKAATGAMAKAPRTEKPLCWDMALTQSGCCQVVSFFMFYQSVFDSAGSTETSVAVALFVFCVVIYARAKCIPTKTGPSIKKFIV